MKKILMVSAVVIVALVALGFVGYAYAQTQQPGNPGGYYGRGGMMGGRGGMMGGAYAGQAYGPVHQYMVNAIAEAFDMTPEALQARLDAGDTFWTVAQEKGLTQDEFFTLMKDARTTALAQAVADGVITQAQADWMLERMEQMQDYGGGFGSCPGGMYGRGRWNQNSQPAGPQG